MNMMDMNLLMKNTGVGVNMKWIHTLLETRTEIAQLMDAGENVEMCRRGGSAWISTLSIDIERYRYRVTTEIWEPKEGEYIDAIRLDEDGAEIHLGAYEFRSMVDGMCVVRTNRNRYIVCDLVKPLSYTISEN